MPQNEKELDRLEGVIESICEELKARHRVLWITWDQDPNLVRERVRIELKQIGADSDSYVRLVYVGFAGTSEQAEAVRDGFDLQDFALLVFGWKPDAFHR